MSVLLDALSMAFGMTWEIVWALILSFVLSGVVQAVVSKGEVTRLFPDDSPRSVATATALGAARACLAAHEDSQIMSEAITTTAR